MPEPEARWTRQRGDIKTDALEKGVKTVVGSMGALSSTGRKLAQNGSILSKNNRLRVVMKGVYDVGTPERRAGPESSGSAVRLYADMRIAPLHEAGEPWPTSTSSHPGGKARSGV
jgi:hypothetical protein